LTEPVVSADPRREHRALVLALGINAAFFFGELITGVLCSDAGVCVAAGGCPTISGSAQPRRRRVEVVGRSVRMALRPLQPPSGGAWMGVMDDVIFVALFVGMMLLAFGYVRLCERIVGDDTTEELR
jgi:hypothetical protein